MTQRPNDSIRIINPIEFTGWDDRIATLPGSSFFHTSAWARVLSETYNYKPTYFTLFDGDRIVGILPVMDVKSILTGHRGVSLPFTDFSEPIADNDQNFQNLFNHAVAYGKQSGWKYLEFRGGQCFLPDAAPSQIFLTHTLDLACGEKKLTANLRDSTRRNIKKAIAEGVTVDIVHTIEAMKEFYRLNCFTRRDHGLPPQPFKFFKAIHKYVISEGYGFVAIAQFQKKTIAANVYLHFGNKAVYKYGASDKEYQSLRASNLVMWEAIRRYLLNGFRELHFGRTEAEHKGLIQYKKGWGCREEQTQYYRYDIRKQLFCDDSNSTKLSYAKILFAIPVPILKAFGNIIYRHSG